MKIHLYVGVGTDKWGIHDQANDDYKDRRSSIYSTTVPLGYETVFKDFVLWVITNTEPTDSDTWNVYYEIDL